MQDNKLERFIKRYWKYVTDQEADKLRGCFYPDACIRWHCTDEQFTAEEFIRANCEYPGRWKSKVERVAVSDQTLITVTRVWTEGASFHVVSFFRMEKGKIRELDEYWGDDGPAPGWRQEMKIGRRISGAKNYTYMLRCRDGSLYTGWTNDLKKRVSDHQAGRGGKYTKAHRPVQLVYSEVFATKEEAMRREWEIKHMTKAQKEALIEKPAEKLTEKKISRTEDMT